METTENTKKWAAKRFGLTPADVIWYNSGNCYNRVMVTTREAAEKVAKAVEGDTVNGGWFDGMPLGAIQHFNGEGFDVMC